MWLLSEDSSTESCGSCSSPSHFFSRRKETCTRTMGHEVGIVALVASRVERLFYAHKDGCCSC